MIKEFNNFLNEKMGRITQVEELTDFIWPKYKNYPKDKTFVIEDLESGDFKINKLSIGNFNDPIDRSRMGFIHEVSNMGPDGKYNISLVRNTAHDTIKSDLHHELIHAYQYYKLGGVEYKMPDKHLMDFVGMDSENTILKDFILVMYAIDKSEMIAFFNDSIIFYKENKNRFKKLGNLLVHTDLVKWFEFVKDYDIDEIKTCEKSDIQTLIKTYYTVRRERLSITNPKGYENKFQYFKDMSLDLFVDNKEQEITINDNEINAFVNKFKKEIEFKKRLYKKYIGRLITIINGREI